MSCHKKPQDHEPVTRQDPKHARGHTPREVARLLRCSAEKVRRLIERGELAAIDMGNGGGKRYVILPDQLAAFVESRGAATPAVKPQQRRRKAPGQVDYFPDVA
jgi:excisionase family DNA binding protein